MFNVEPESVSEGWHTYELRSTMIPNASSGMDDEEHFCKLILYKEIKDSRVRIWDVIILVPNLLFLIFIAIRFNRARLRLRATSSPVFLAFYGLVICNVFISVIRCVVSMTVNAAATVGGKADKVLWVTVRFFLLFTEMSVVIFGLAFGHLDSRSSIRRVLLATSFIALAFTITQGTLELILPDDTFHIPSRDFYVFGHGGMMFWFCSSLVFTMIYLFILILPWTRLRERVALPTRKSFYFYASALATMDLVQSIGAGFLNYTQNPIGLCIIDFTAMVYLTLFTPLVYHTFLSEFFGVSQPSIMFSYNAQVDDTMDDDTVSLPHQQSFTSLRTDSDYIYQVHTPSIQMPLYDSQRTQASTSMHRTSLHSLTSTKDSRYGQNNPYSSQIALHTSASGIKNYTQRFSTEKNIQDFAHYPLTKSDSFNLSRKSSLDFKSYNEALKKNLFFKVKLGTARSVSNLISPANTASNFIYNPRVNNSSANLFCPTNKNSSESALTAVPSFDKERSDNLSFKYNKNVEIYMNPKSFSERSLDTSDAPLLEDTLQNILQRDTCEFNVADSSHTTKDKSLTREVKSIELSKDKSQAELQKIKKDHVFFESRLDNPLVNIYDLPSARQNLLPQSTSFSIENMPKSSCDYPKRKESAGLNQYLLSLTSPNPQETVKENPLGESASKQQSKSLYTQTDSL